MLVSLLATPVFAESQGSIDLVLGKSTHEADYDSMQFLSESDTAITIRGSYAITPYIGVELGYSDHGEVDTSYVDGFGDFITDKFSVTSLNLGLKGTIPLDDKFSLNARLGMSDWSMDIEEKDSSFPGITFQYEEDGTDMYYGIGLQFQATPQLRIGVEYTKTSLEPSDSDVNYDITHSALSLGYTF
ncbi:porin family protein [Agitococcus lubricus]|nr:porin family protein [Agitococcus lubricus]